MCDFPIKEYISLVFTGLSLIVGYFSFWIAVKSFVLTKKIAKETEQLQKKQFLSQEWSTLMAEYRSPQFGEAVKSITDFFVNDCQKELKRVEKEYIEIFEKEQKKIKRGTMKSEDCLHFKRRLLAQYYYQVWYCIKIGETFGDLSGSTELEHFFNKNEMNLIAIVHSMNKAAGKPKCFIKLVDNPELKSDLGKMTDVLENLYNKFNDLFHPEEGEVLAI